MAESEIEALKRQVKELQSLKQEVADLRQALLTYQGIIGRLDQIDAGIGEVKLAVRQLRVKDQTQEEHFGLIETGIADVQKRLTTIETSTFRIENTQERILALLNKRLPPER